MKNFGAQLVSSEKTLTQTADIDERGKGERTTGHGRLSNRKPAAASHESQARIAVGPIGRNLPIKIFESFRDRIAIGSAGVLDEYAAKPGTAIATACPDSAARSKSEKPASSSSRAAVWRKECGVHPSVRINSLSWAQVTLSSPVGSRPAAAGSHFTMRRRACKSDFGAVVFPAARWVRKETFHTKPWIDETFSHTKCLRSAAREHETNSTQAARATRLSGQAAAAAAKRFTSKVAA